MAPWSPIRRGAVRPPELVAGWVAGGRRGRRGQASDKPDGRCRPSSTNLGPAGAGLGMVWWDKFGVSSHPVGETHKNTNHPQCLHYSC